jgi:hypothetical protein
MDVIAGEEDHHGSIVTVERSLDQAERDLVSLIAGLSPAPLSRRSRTGSRALVELLLGSWNILPAIPEAVFDGPLAAILRPEDHARLGRARRAVTAFIKAQMASCRPFVQALGRAGLNYTLLKGSAISCLTFSTPYLRAGWDFDVGVACRDIAGAEALARSSGFWPAEYDPPTKQFVHADLRLRAQVEARHYELGFLARRIEVTNLSDATIDAIRAEPWTRQFWSGAEAARPWCYAVLDIHHAISRDIGLDALLAISRTITIGEDRVSVPDPVWLAAHLIFKIYWEGLHSYSKGLYQYGDLIRLLPLFTPESFADLVEILASFNLTAGGYYVFRRIPLFGVRLPEFVREFVNANRVPKPGLDPGEINDLGDMWPKLWGRR